MFSTYMNNKVSERKRGEGEKEGRKRITFKVIEENWKEMNFNTKRRPLSPSIIDEKKPH